MDLLAVDHQDVVLGLVGGGLLGRDRALELALGGVVFEQVSEVVSRDDVADGDDIELLAEEALFDEGAENEAADAAETIDRYFNCHGGGGLWSVELDRRKCRQSPGNEEHAPCLGKCDDGYITQQPPRGGGTES
jgi:hypothetical protein